MNKAADLWNEERAQALAEQLPVLKPTPPSFRHSAKKIFVDRNSSRSMKVSFEGRVAGDSAIEYGTVRSRIQR
ncbi:MAG: hypothetical protein JHD07_31885 [Bradyrhizobium sp.]|nr:hypothetical protein [Bradyrhizobium sp.]